MREFIETAPQFDNIKSEFEDIFANNRIRLLWSIWFRLDLNGNKNTKYLNKISCVIYILINTVNVGLE